MLILSRGLAVLVMAFAITACGTVNIGRDFDVHSFETKIERGVTTQKQVAQWLGDPASVGISVDTAGERFDEWTYYFASAKAIKMTKSTFKMLQIKFDKDGIARSYHWTDSAR